MLEFFSHPIPAVILLLGILVLVHELGHFLVGRWCGIAVETFSIGFGPPIFGFKRHGTEYRLSWIPLGGYVKFAGAHPAETVPPGLRGEGFLKVPLLHRVLTVAAGPLANFLLAIVVYTILGMAGIQHPPAIIGDVVVGSPAQAAGLLYGDKLLKINDQPIAHWRELEKNISEAPGRELTLVVERAGSTVQVKLTPASVDLTDMAGRKTQVGRAGVALGRLPAILTLLHPQSVAAQAQLKTGDRVSSLTEMAQGEVVGSSMVVTYYPELLQLIRAATSKADVDAVLLTVHEAPMPSADDELAAGSNSVLPPTDQHAAAKPVERRIVLPLAALKNLPHLDSLEPRRISDALGFTDSQLTVADATESARSVLQKNDRLVSWQGVPLRDIFHLGELLRNNNQEKVTATVERAGMVTPVELTLSALEVQRPDGKATIFTLPTIFLGQPEAPEPIIEQYKNPLLAIRYGIRETAVQTATLFTAIAHLFSGDIPMQALGGPMLIAKVAGDSARRGWQTFVGSMALISINLGLLNLFPIPVLDGGQLLLMAAEGLRRRPLRETAVENFQKIGFAMIMALVVLATYNDLSRFWKSMLESVVGIFQ